jgi:hypothetical protein
MEQSCQTIEGFPLAVPACWRCSGNCKSGLMTQCGKTRYAGLRVLNQVDLMTTLYEIRRLWFLSMLLSYVTSDARCSVDMFALEICGDYEN